MHRHDAAVFCDLLEDLPNVTVGTAKAVERSKDLESGHSRLDSLTNLSDDVGGGTSPANVKWNAKSV